MINRMFEAVIFDCDGTLVDSEPITIDVLVEYLSECGLNLEPKQAHSLFLGRDMPAIESYLVNDRGLSLPSDFTGEFRNRQAAALESRLQPMAGAFDLLAAMTRPYCLASNAPPEKIAINLSVTGLEKFFDETTVFSAYEIESWKPNPDLFLHAAGKLDVDPEDCVVVEDSPAGIEAGLAAGMQVIGYQPGTDGEFEFPVPTARSLHELITVFTD